MHLDEVRPRGHREVLAYAEALAAARRAPETEATAHLGMQAVRADEVAGADASRLNSDRVLHDRADPPVDELHADIARALRE